MTTNAEQIYADVRAGKPEAVAYYQNLKTRIADGKRAQIVYDCIRTVHERREKMKNRSLVGADAPAGSYVTPNGKILTPSTLSQLVNLFREATFMPTASAPLPTATTAPKPAAVPAAAAISVPKNSLAINQAALAAIKPKSKADQLQEQYANAIRQKRPASIIAALKKQWENALAAEGRTKVVSLGKR